MVIDFISIKYSLPVSDELAIWFANAFTCADILLFCKEFVLEVDNMAKITIRGIRCRANIGVTAIERATSQLLRIDLVYQVAAEVIAKTDQLANTIDYVELSNWVIQFVERQQCDLLETLLHRLKQSLIAEFKLAELELTIHKPEAKLAADAVFISE